MIDHDEDEDDEGFNSSAPQSISKRTAKISQKTDTDMDYSQWQVGANGKFRAAAQTIAHLHPGVYKIDQDDLGPFLQLQTVISDNIVELPETANVKVLSGMKKFWQSQDRYNQFGLVYKRGILLWGPPGCHSAGTKVIMFDGSTKKVEDVVEGDLLMGPDSTSRTVEALCRGRDEMYRVFPVKGDAFDVNGHHILPLRFSGTDALEEIAVKDYANLSAWKKNRLKLWKPNGLEFGEKILTIDPYFFGLWLGDGSSKGPSITTEDLPIVQTVRTMAASVGLSVRQEIKPENAASTYFVTSGEKHGAHDRNILLTHLQQLGVIENKHIPDIYLRSSLEQRLRLLAGLLDSDGSYNDTLSTRHKGYFEITQKNERLANEIVFLSRSLGYGAEITPVTKTIKSRNFSGNYFHVSIWGADLTQIPTRLARKQATNGHPNKNHLRTGIKSVIPLGFQDYYGFILDGDHLYETSDFFVNHNSGKSVTINLLMKELIGLNGIVLLCGHPDLLSHMLQRVRGMEPDRPIIVVLEDIDEIIDKHGEHAILSMLDGENQIANVTYLATTNYPDKLGARIVNRPSRFDERIFVGMPSPVARKAYLKFATMKGDMMGLDDATLTTWTNDTEGFSIAHLRELVAACFCLEQQYPVVVKRLKKMSEKPKFGDGYNKKAGFMTEEEDAATESAPKQPSDN